MFIDGGGRGSLHQRVSDQKLELSVRVGFESFDAIILTVVATSSRSCRVTGFVEECYKILMGYACLWID